MKFKEELQEALKEAISQINLSGIEPQVEHPENMEHGDYSTNVAIQLKSQSAKIKSTTQKSKVNEFETSIELAQKIVNELRKNEQLSGIVDKIEVVPPGFINFWLSKNALSRELSLALKAAERYGESKMLSEQNLMVEFAHPNTHKEFHIGHLRNITLGETLCRLFEASGARVVRTNYQGDVGLHIAKALFGLLSVKRKTQNVKLGGKVKILAQAYVGGNKAYVEDENAKKKIEEINMKLYQGDPKLTELWKETREWSLNYFDSIYKRLGTKFNRLYFESEVAKTGLDLVNKYLDNVFEKSGGAIIYPGERYGLHNRVFVNKFGLPTYEGKDIGLAYLQFDEFKPDKITHIVGPEQTEYFRVVFSALEKVLPETKGREFHLPYGWVRLKTGKMSSRTGDVVSAVWLLDEIKKQLKGSFEDMDDDVAEAVAVGAVKYSMLRLHSHSEIAFDIEESVRLDGDSGPYLQYTYARCRSVLRKAGIFNFQFSIFNESKNFQFSKEELSLLRTFYRFPEVVEAAANQYSPNLLCNFLYDLASKYNLLYNNLSILDPENDRGAKGDGENRGGKGKEIREFRLALTAVTGQILKTGLGLLGIKAPDKM